MDLTLPFSLVQKYPGGSLRRKARTGGSAPRFVALPRRAKPLLPKPAESRA